MNTPDNKSSNLFTASQKSWLWYLEVFFQKTFNNLIYRQNIIRLMMFSESIPVKLSKIGCYFSKFLTSSRLGVKISQLGLDFDFDFQSSNQSYPSWLDFVATLMQTHKIIFDNHKGDFLRFNLVKPRGLSWLAGVTSQSQRFKLARGLLRAAVL